MVKTKKDTTNQKTVKAAAKKAPVKEKSVKAGKKTMAPVEEAPKNLAVEAPEVVVNVEETTEQVVVADTKTKSSKGKKTLITGTGKRKTAVARIFLYESKGEFTVNGKDINTYFPSEQAQAKWMKPFHAIGIAHPTSKYSATIKVHGSGPSAQLAAVAHGFSRALAGMSEEFSEVLHKSDLLTRDPRMVERKKYWLRKARKAPQYSKR